MSIADAVKSALSQVAAEVELTESAAAAARDAGAAVLLRATAELNAHPADSNIPALALRDLALLYVFLDYLRCSFLLPALLRGHDAVHVLKARNLRVARSLQPFKVTAAQLQAFSPILAHLSTESAVDWIVQLLSAEVGLLTHAACDPRLVDRYLPETLATAMWLQRTGVPVKPEWKRLLDSCLQRLPPRLAAMALLTLASGRLFEAGAVGPGAHPTAAAAAADAVPDIDALLPWLRVAAASELGRLTMLPGGVDGVVDSVLQSVDSENAVAVDAAQAHAAGIVSTPPLELCTEEEYFTALGPQLHRLLRTAGSYGAALAQVAALALIRLLDRSGGGGAAGTAAQRDSHAWRHVIQPILKPLLAYYGQGLSGLPAERVRPLPRRAPTTKQADTSLLAVESSRAEGGDVAVAEDSIATVMDEGAVTGCVEDLHRILSAAPLSSVAATSLLLVLPALFALYRKAAANKLRAGFATACQEVLCSILSRTSPGLAAACCAQLLGLQSLLQGGNGGGGGGGSSSSSTAAVIAPADVAFAASLPSRHPYLAYALGDSASIVLVQHSVPVLPDGSRVDAATGPGLRLPGAGAGSGHRKPRSGGMLGGFDAAKAGLQGLFNLSGQDGGLSGVAAATAGGASAPAPADPSKPSEGLAGVSGHGAESAAAANALVDVLQHVRSSKHSEGHAEASAATRIFSVLLAYYSRSRLSSLSSGSSGDSEAEAGDGDDTAANALQAFSGPEDVRALQLLVCMSERMGADLLRSNVHVVQAVRHVLAVAVTSCGLQLPDPQAVGCGGPNSEAHKIHMACLPGHTLSTPASAAALARASEEVSELLSTCLGLLLVMAQGSMTALEEEEEEEKGDGASRVDKAKQDDADEELADPVAARRLYDWLRSTLPLLAALSEHPDPHIAEMATALRALLLALPAPVLPAATSMASASASAAPASPSSTKPTSAAADAADAATVSRTLREAMALVMDPAPALQAHGFRQLSKLIAADPPSLRPPDAVSSGTAATVTPQIAAILDLAVKGLDNSDTPVFLAAVDALQSLGSVYPAALLPKLLKLYAEEHIPIRSRVKLGEALAVTAAQLGRSGMLPAFAPVLLAVLMKTGVAGWREQQRLQRALLTSSSSEAPATDAALRDASHPYNLSLRLSDVADLRASAVTALGEAAAYLQHALAAAASDVIDGLSGIIGFEADPLSVLPSPPDAGTATDEADAHKEGSKPLITVVPTVEARPIAGAGPAARQLVVDSAAQVRRAAALAIRRLLEGDGLSDSAGSAASVADGGSAVMRGFRVTARGAVPLPPLITRLGDHLPALYRVVQGGAARDPDALVRAHLHDALAVLDDVMKAMLQGQPAAATAAGRVNAVQQMVSATLPAASLSAVGGYSNRS